MSYADIIFDDNYLEEEKIPGLRNFYRDYGMALLASIKRNFRGKQKNLEEIVKELELESEKGNEEASELLIEIQQSEVLY